MAVVGMGIAKPIYASQTLPLCISVRAYDCCDEYPSNSLGEHALSRITHCHLEANE